jgi:DNA-binding response OmpR family regulator
METTQGEAVPASQAERRSVLVIEDDPDMCQVIRTILEEEGYEVQTASSGWQALEQKEGPKPALVILDMTLPDLDGEQVSEGLRTLHGEGIPMLVVTGHTWAAERAVRAGAVDYVRKPFELEELVEAVRRAIGG